MSGILSLSLKTETKEKCDNSSKPGVSHRLICPLNWHKCFSATKLLRAILWPLCQSWVHLPRVFREERGKGVCVFGGRGLSPYLLSQEVGY